MYPCIYCVVSLLVLLIHRLLWIICAHSAVTAQICAGLSDAGRYFSRVSAIRGGADGTDAGFVGVASGGDGPAPRGGLALVQRRPREYLSTNTGGVCLHRNYMDIE
jgi:hypothetical protein